MEDSRISSARRVRALELGAAALALLAIAAALALDSSWLGTVCIHHVAGEAQREIQIDGPVHTRFLSLAPRLTAERVTISNPPWTARGVTAHLGKMTLRFRWSSFHHPLKLEALELKSAVVSLLRDAGGRSNWQWGAPGTPASEQPPMIHGLSVPDAEVRLDDDILHLHFTGRVSACSTEDASGERPCRVQGKGELNGRPVLFTIEGDRLASARTTAPYRFAFEESSTSTGSHLSGHGVLPRPFDVTQLDATFEAAGKNLKDIYFLTGVRLLDTAPYRLRGALRRRGGQIAFHDLAATSGQSDVSGTVLIRSAGTRSLIDANLSSKLLRLRDLESRAAGRAPRPAGEARQLLPATPLGLKRFRGSNASVRIAADRLALDRIVLQAAAARIAFEPQAIVVQPLAARLAQGELSGELRIDLLPEVPAVTLDLLATHVHLGKLGPLERASANSAPPPLEGPLEARLTMTGHGDSLHAIAATAAGRITAVVPHGAIRASIAELAGLDPIRLLGLTFGEHSKEATVRCAIASLQAREGTLDVERLMIDTGPALIVGHGQVDLGSEALDLRLRDEPTHVRLLGEHVPVRIGGTLRHPSVSVKGPGALGKIGATAALAAVLTPIDALRNLFKPDRTEDSSCPAVLAEAQREEARAGTAPGRR
jgi:AsmA family protein